MVVGITITTITILRRSGKKGKEATFIDPDSFRETLEGTIEGAARRESALVIVDSMKQLVEEYDDFLRESLDLYLTRIPDFDETPAGILEQLERLRFAERLLYQQERLRKNLRPQRWALLVTELNDAERMERVLGRRG